MSAKGPPEGGLELHRIKKLWLQTPALNVLEFSLKKTQYEIWKYKSLDRVFVVRSQKC